MRRAVAFGLMAAVAGAFLAASWSGAGAYRRTMDDGPTRVIAAVQKRVDDRRRFEAGLMRGAELVAFRDSVESRLRSDSTQVARRAQRAAETAAALAAGRPDPHRPVIRSTPTYGGGPSYGK